jgi:urease accessory protein UreH
MTLVPTQLPDQPNTRLPDSRAIQCIGRAARLELVFEKRGERTILAHAYAEPPYRLGRTFDLGGAAYVILVTSGPGVFAGDTLRQSIHIGRGARVVLASQSALQVHPGPSALPPGLPAVPRSGASAVLQHSFDIEEEAELHCQWDPVIPFAGARLEQRFDLRIAESSRLFWGDAVMAGRVQRGEAWQFLSLAHELRLRIGPSLAYLERYALSPDDRAIERPWICGGTRYLATALVHHEAAGPAAAEALHREMAELAGVRSAVDVLGPRLLLARFVAENGAPFARARASYRSAILRSIFGGAERAGRK